MERKTNVLIVASSLWIGGAETMMRRLAETIDRRRFNVSVCYLKDRGQIGEALERAGIDIVGIAGSKRVDYLSFMKLLNVIRSRNIDVVHTHTTHGLVDAILCKAFRPALKVIHTFHFGNYPHTTPRILWMERVFSRFANRLLAVGEVQRGQVRSVYRLSERAIQTLWNGVVFPSAEGDPSFRRRIGAENVALVGTIATLIEQKGLRDLMKVARCVRDAGHSVKFVIVGDGPLRSELEAMRRDLDLDDTVALTGWVTNAADVALPTFDIFFQPSLWEAMSVVTLEAMGASKPAVITRVGEAPHFIDDGVDGVLVGPGDVAGMASSIIRLLKDADLRQRMGCAARRKVEERFTVRHMTQAYEQVYLDATR